MSNWTREPQDLGQIVLWPKGYAMSLGTWLGGNEIVRCCVGHETPEAAKSHGLARLIEVGGEIADRDIAAWAAKDGAA